MRFFLISNLLFIILSCSDEIKQKENDILKYEYLAPFVLKGQKFTKGNLNIDNNQLIYSYEVSDIKDELMRVHNKAITAGWKQRGNSYYKYIPLYENSGETIFTSVTAEGNKIEFNVWSK